MSMRPVKTQISLGIHPVWSESSLCAKYVAKDPRFIHVDSKDSDQTGLIWVFAGRTLTLLVLSCRGSYRKTGNFRVIQFSQYFAVSINPRKLKSAKYFPIFEKIVLSN